MNDERYTVATMLIVDIANKHGVRSIKDLAGCWEFDAGDWHLSVNGHSEPVANSQGRVVPQFAALCEDTNHLRIVIVDPSGGECIGLPRAEDALIEALEKELNDG